MKKTIFMLLLILFPTCVFCGEWYEGGTLFEANALEWQKATYANKMATCANFLAAYAKAGLLNDDLTSRFNEPDDYKPYAIELANSLDKVFKRDPDDGKNIMLFSNQEVKTFAAMIVIGSGWAKPEYSNGN